jgi:DNA polymerase bacteriophage-type
VPTHEKTGLLSPEKPMSTLDVVSNEPANIKPKYLFLDFETRSRLNLRQVSTKRYAQDNSTEVLCFAYAIDDGPVTSLTPGALPEDIAQILANPGSRISAHNAKFECLIWNEIMVPRFGWPPVAFQKFICSMGMAHYAGLPGSLDGAAAALGLAERKDLDGEKLMLAIATHKIELTPENMERLQGYCRQDVVMERELTRRLHPLPYFEHRVWLLDHIINQRGLPIDRALAVAIAAMVKNYQPVINARIAELTSGTVLTPGQGKRILKYLAAEGCTLGNLQKPTVKKALEREITEAAKELLELRAAGNQSAATKATALLRGLDDDDRLRDALVYHGAGPGRWTAKGFQPQNLKRPPETFDSDAAIAAVMSGDIARVEALGAPLSVVANLSRAMLCAPLGHVFIGADFSSIESCVISWLSGEEWKLTNYREFFRTGNPELEPYCQTASRLLKRKVTPADKEGRALGKVADLALGFGGGVNAWRNGALKSGREDTRPDEAIKKDIYAWRDAHQQIKRFWDELERTLRRAIRRPGDRIRCGRLTAEFRDGTLRVFLPSGRAISYPEARLD